MKIRAVSSGDVPQIVQLIGEIWAEYDCVLDADKEETYLLAPVEYFHARQGEFWVLETDFGQVVATVAVMMLDENTAELKTLYVRRDVRRAGRGERLARLAIDFAREKGAREMVLWSDTRFTAAHRLYARLGFVQTGLRQLDDVNRSVEYGFRKSISAALLTLAGPLVAERRAGVKCRRRRSG